MYSVDAVTNGRNDENYIYPTDYDCIILGLKLQELKNLNKYQINNRYNNNFLFL